MASITEFQSSLLRERFIIHDPDSTRSDNSSITALSNRMVVSLQKDADTPAEEYIIRTQNMHSCIRLTSRIIHSFNIGGSLLNRAKPYDWEATWEPVVNDYERVYNEERWVCVYHRGKVVFESGERHPLLDLIEKCDFENDKDYEYAIPMAEDAFKQTGKVLKLDYDANVALTLTFDGGEGRCGVILRGANGTTTFNFKTSPKNDEALNIPQCISASAAFLEGIQLAFMIGFNIFKINVGILDRNAAEDKQTKEAQRRLGRLNAEISNLETVANVRYRPEKPELYRIVTEAEELASKTIEVPKKEPKPFGADDPVEDE